MKKRVYVKPVVPYVNEHDSQGWMVVVSTPIREFFDDWRRYGLRVAAYNLSRALP